MSSEQLSAAVTAELRAAPEATQRKACKATVAALFAAEMEALKIPSERVLQAKKSYVSSKGPRSSAPRLFLSKSVSSMVILMQNGASTPGVGIRTNPPVICRLFSRVLPAKSSEHGNLC